VVFLFVWLFFAFKIDCCFDYISLKALCHYQSPDVPEAIQKKAYGILAPLCSQKPWKNECKEPKVDNKSYSQIQAAFYILISFNFPKELQYKIFDSVYFEMRQYKSFSSKADFIPFLHGKKIWSLQEGHLLFSGIGWRSESDEYVLRLNESKPYQRGLEASQVVKTNEPNLVMCLFKGFGLMFLVDLKAMKEVWRRKYRLEDGEDGGRKNTLVYDDSYGYLITGYNNIFCFMDNLTGNFKLYSLSDLIDNKLNFCEIENDIQFDELLLALNSKYFFCAASPKKNHSGPSYQIAGGQPDKLYYVSYMQDSNKKIILHTLSKSYFIILRSNDTCLVAKDNKGTIFVWDLTQKSIVLKNVINSDQNMIGHCFWLDSDSDKIVTQDGIYKIENVFADLPTLPSIVVIKPVIKTLPPSVIKPILEEKIPILEPAFSLKYGFFKGLCLRIYWFVRSWYWVIKSLLKKHSIS
jgi:hypothetical protein